MANIYWYNGSSDTVKWMEYDTNGNWTGSGLSTGEYITRPDTGIEYSGFLGSGFTGIIYSPMSLPQGYSAIHYAFNVPPTAAEVKELQKKIAKK